MTPPMTRPLHPIFWMIVVGSIVVVLAMPFLRSDGLLGWLAKVAVAVVVSALWIALIFGIIRNYLDSRKSDGQSCEPNVAGEQPVANRKSLLPEEPRDVPAVVRTVISNKTLQIVLWPGVGMADGGIPIDVPIESVPIELRLPNTVITVTMHGSKVIATRSRDSAK